MVRQRNCFNGTTKKLTRNSIISSASRGREKTKPSQIQWLAAASLLVTLFAALVATAGRAYRDSYLYFYGFDSGALPWNSSDLSYLGITEELNFMARALIFTFGAFSLLGILLYLVTVAGEKVRTGRKYSTRVIKNPKQLDNEIAVFFYMAFAAGILFYFALPLIITIAHAERDGRDRAQAELTAINRHDIEAAKKLDVTYVLIRRVVGGSTVENRGIEVSCTEKFCDLYDAQQTHQQQTVQLDNVVTWERRPLEELFGQTGHTKQRDVGRKKLEANSLLRSITGRNDRRSSPEEIEGTKTDVTIASKSIGAGRRNNV